jgi:hypothetical protein
VCEIWKWIAVGTGAPLVVLVFWIASPWFIWPLTYLVWASERRGWRLRRRAEQAFRYQRFLLLDAAVCFVAVVISLTHCNP